MEFWLFLMGFKNCCIRLLEKSRAGTLAKLLVGSLWKLGICLMRWIKQDPDHSKKTVNQHVFWYLLVLC